MPRRALLLILLVFAIAACAGQASPTATPAPTTPPPTDTPAPTATPAQSPTPLIGFAGPTPTLGPTVDPSLVPSPTITPTPVITAEAPADDVIGRNEIYETDLIYVSGLYENPWDDATLALTFTAPSGELISVGGFYYGTDTWRVRFVPQEVGRYTWTAEFTDPFGTRTDAGALMVVESETPGFVRAAPDNRFRWVLEDGTPYHPIGLQDCLEDLNGNGNPLDDLGLDGGVRASPEDPGRRVGLNGYLDTYAAAGFNLWRWGAESCGFKLWEEIDPEGNEYLNQPARFGDTLVSALRARGFRIYANIFANAPPFPEDTGDGPRMNAVIRYVRYFVNRYAAYVDYWELMSQANVSEEWYNLIANTVRQADPYDHPIATNFERPDIVLIDINSPHWYESEDEFASDVVTANLARDLRRWRKPIIFSEQGNALLNWDPRSATRMRLRAWTAFFEEATLIFWNTSFATDFVGGGRANIYLGPEERGYIRALQDFAAGFDSAATPADVSTSASQTVRAYGLRSSTMFAAYVVNGIDHSNPTTGLTLTADMPSGTAVWVDPTTGNTLGSLEVAPGRRTLNVPGFVTDMALRVE